MIINTSTKLNKNIYVIFKMKFIDSRSWSIFQNTSRITIIIFIMITIIFCILSLLHIYETFCGGDRIPEYLKHKSKCYDCETDIRQRYGEESVWRAQPSKMFSAEQQGVDMYGEEGGFVGKTIKYY